MAYFSSLSTRNYRKYLEFGALCLLAIGLLWWFGRKLNWGEVRSAVSHSNPYLLLGATAIISLAYLFRALRWGAFLRPLGPARLNDLFAATTVGFGAVFLVGRAGEVVRPVVLPMRDPRVRASASFVTILVERLYDMMAVVLLFSINLLWFKPPIKLGNEFARVRLVGLILLLGAILGVAGLMWFRKRSPIVVKALDLFFARFHFIPQRLSKLIVSTLEQLARALRVLIDARELAETAAWTAIIWCSIGLDCFLVIRAFGVPFGISETVFVLGWSLVGSLVPTPGGAAGAFHAATAADLIFLGVTRETSAAISIVLHVIDFGPAVLFGFFYVIRGDLNLSRLRSLASPETVEHAVEDETLLPDDNPNQEQRLESPAAAAGS